MVFEDGTAQAVSQVGGNGSDWYLDDSQYTLGTGMWKGDRASLRSLRQSLPKGMNVPDFERNDL